MNESYEFVRTLWENCREGYDTKLDIREATTDLQRFRDAEWNVPEDLTPEEFMEYWNELVEYQIGEIS